MTYDSKKILDDELLEKNDAAQFFFQRVFAATIVSAFLYIILFVIIFFENYSTFKTNYDLISGHIIQWTSLAFLQIFIGMFLLNFVYYKKDYRLNIRGGFLLAFFSSMFFMMFVIISMFFIVEKGYEEVISEFHFAKNWAFITLFKFILVYPFALLFSRKNKKNVIKKY